MVSLSCMSEGIEIGVGGSSGNMGESRDILMILYYFSPRHGPFHSWDAGWVFDLDTMVAKWFESSMCWFLCSTIVSLLLFLLLGDLTLYYRIHRKVGVDSPLCVVFVEVQDDYNAIEHHLKVHVAGTAVVDGEICQNHGKCCNNVSM